MKKLILATSIALCLSTGATQSAFATQTPHYEEVKKSEDTNEVIGFGSGAIAGGVIAGPVGAFIGGIFGLLIADDVNSDKQIKQAKQALVQANVTVKSQQQSVLALQTELSSMQQQQLVQLASFDEQSQQTSSEQWLNNVTHLETNLQFKTASFLVEDIYQEQLNSVANLLVNYPQLSIKVTGFADQRGDSQFNKVLSEQRAGAVKEYLLSKSVSANQIHCVGMGEMTITQVDDSEDSNAIAKLPIDIEDLFFARKVNLSLLKSSEHMTAAN